MNGEYRTMTIKEAIDKIDSRKLLLPGIQRKFVWSSNQIEALFDSLMRDYPINTMMLWKVSDRQIIDNHRFYTFLSKFREHFQEENDSISLKGKATFDAVIDGQQRLTSLYIGLKGSYAYRTKGKWLADTEASLPSRKLFLHLGGEVANEDEGQMLYRFSFLSEADREAFSEDDKLNWYEVGNILKLRREEEDLDPFLDRRFPRNAFAKKTLRKLWKLVHYERKLAYYYETNSEPNAVLHMFIRLNMGGTELSYSDLIMSITSATWETAKEEMSTLLAEIGRIGASGFIVTKDFILKACLVLLSENVKFDLKNFNDKTAIRLQKEWNRIRASVLLAFELADTVGFDNITLRAKNAIIPVIHFIYSHELETQDKSKKSILKQMAVVREWLVLSTLKGFFSGQSDAILTRVRKILRQNADADLFPLQKIKDEFKADPNRNLSFNDDFISELLQTRKADRDAYLILSLLYKHYPATCRYHMDHLHPEAGFIKLKKKDIPKDKPEYFKPEIWDSILNLQLLHAGSNQSKLDETLLKWLAKHPEYKKDALMPKSANFDLAHFPEFIEERRVLLTDALKNI